ncbi:MAG: radical SAM protein, partial [Nitrososphaerales archaeon]
MPIRSPEALLFENNCPELPKGFRAYFQRNSKRNTSNGVHIISLPESLSYLLDGDIVHCTPRMGQLRVVYRRNSPFNSMLVTEQCNSNCVMCSQPPRDIDDSYLVDVYLQAIPLMDPGTAKLGITGGEPTLLGDKFLRIVRACKNFLPNTSLHVLSNGRLFSYLSLCQAVEKIVHPSLMFGIPIYSDVSNLHDYVVQAEGAFDETIRGIMNLRRCNQRIEVRVVLHSLTIERLPKLAEFLCRNLPFVDHIALMGLE